MHLKGICMLWVVMLFIQLSISKRQHRRYTGRFQNNNRSPSHRFTQNLKLFPGGTEKRTVYTGRYCAYPTTRRVPHRVKNGTQTYLQRIVSQCPWSSLYCNPQVRYVVSSRYSYKIKMKEITRDEWRCCPGFHGSNCEKTCFNCTIATDLKKRLEEISQQISFVPRNQHGPSASNVSQGFEYLRGPIGPPGSMGLRGQRGHPGSVGPKGDVGPVGPRGFPGVAGSNGEKGASGADGSPGFNGTKGEKGDAGKEGVAGPAGIGGPKGESGEAGFVGPKGDMGPAGPMGLGGETGGPGPAGPVGPEGPRGLQGIMGPPGVCKCDSGSAVVTDILENENNGSNACVYEGKSRQHKEVWKPSICRECMCFEGSINCSSISCPVNSCQFKYKPSDFCCPVCCPNQDGESMENMSGDGAEETLSNADNETSPQPEYDSREEIEVEENENSNDRHIPTNVAGCPMLSVTARGVSSSRTNRNAVQACTFPKDPGPCRAAIPKLYFDGTAMRCRPFTYGGCEGNANKFDTPQECNRRCGVLAKDSSPRARHDDARSRRPRKCNLRKATGDCRAHMPRFYYNRREGRCRLFVYGGCNGNDNRFSTPWECRDVCGGSTPVFSEGQQRKKRRRHKRRKPAKCYLPKVEGPCRSSQSRFYYNHKTRRCQIFMYGGCGGNENNFKLPADCKAVCGGKPTFQYENRNSGVETAVRARSFHSTTDKRCNASLDSGPCKGGFYRYFFNLQTNKCSVFLYGGCRGNENNFETAEECRNTCGGDGFNFTLTLESDFAGQTSSNSNENGRRGQRGPPGRRGKPGRPGAGIRGPPGPPGPVGPPGIPATILSSTSDEIKSIKATIESLKSRIVFLETQFLTDLVSAENAEEVNTPSIALPSKSDDLSTTAASSSNEKLRSAPKSSPVGRGDASVEDNPPY